MPPTVVPFRAARPGLAARRQLQRSGGRDVCWLTDTRGRHTALVVRAIHVHTVMTPLAMQSTISSHTTCVAPPCVSSPCTARDTPNVLPAVRGGPRRMCSPPGQRLIMLLLCGCPGLTWLASCRRRCERYWGCTPRRHALSVGVGPAEVRCVDIVGQAMTHEPDAIARRRRPTSPPQPSSTPHLCATMGGGQRPGRTQHHHAPPSWGRASWVGTRDLVALDDSARLHVVSRQRHGTIDRAPVLCRK